MSTTHHEVLIIGGGTAGLTCAVMLCQEPDGPQVTVIEPSDKHRYQPLWTLVGAGVFPREESERNEAEFMPENATWLKERVQSFDPANNAVVLDNGETHTYDWLIVAPGIELRWDMVDGLKDAVGKNGVCSNYHWDTVQSTWENIRNFKGGTAIFTYPNTPIKCAGAPQKIMWMAEHHFERSGVRPRTDIIYGCATPGIFGVAKYARTLNRLVAERHIDARYRSNLVAIKAAEKKAVFENLDTGERSEVAYDMIHVTPPMSAPAFVRDSPLADAAGWVDVHKHTTQHNRFPNVFSLGDASSLPNSKTAAAVRKQAPVTVANLLSARAGHTLTASYDGYASCPLVTGYGRGIMAEFLYGGVPAETLPFDQSQERFSLYTLKAYGLPRMYWHGMLRGRW